MTCCRIAFIVIVFSVGFSRTGPASAQEVRGEPHMREKGGRVVVEGHTFASWKDYATSNYFRANRQRLRCGKRHVRRTRQNLRGGHTDCDINSTTPSDDYSAAHGVYRIAVVVHVIQARDGSGFISEDRVRGQIEVLNEDFRAAAGTHGANGNDTAIEFFLATEDPQGSPSTGITYTTNNRWFEDTGNYWDTLAWDPDRYLNIYTNLAEGALGYVPFLPQEGSVGDVEDRVVMLYSAFGRNEDFAPFDLGRTLTHEVGHYFGLFHTFDGGCDNGDCNQSGDLICDTNAHEEPSEGCGRERSSCGKRKPVDNYMDYSDDRCLERFSHEQVLRMRCTIEHYRPTLIHDGSGPEPGALPVPTGLTADVVDTRVELHWNETNDVRVVGFDVLRSDRPSGPFFVVATGITDSHADDDLVTIGATYYYQVRSVGTDGSTSTASHPVSVTLEPSPIGSSVRLEPNGETSVYLVVENTIPIKAGEVGVALSEFDDVYIEGIFLGPDFPAGDGDVFYDQDPVDNCEEGRGGLGIGWINSFESEILTPPGEHRLLEIVFERATPAEICVDLQLVHCLGDPPFDNVAVTTDDKAFDLRALSDSVEMCFGGPSFQRGDVNADGDLDISDVVRTLSHLFRGEGILDCVDAADVNDDGRIDLSDPVELLAWRFRGTTIIAAPFDTCGEDLTEDGLGCDEHSSCEEQ